MLRYLLTHGPVKRFSKAAPLLYLLSAAEVALIARVHMAKLDASERRRLIELVRKARGRPGSLEDAEREELGALVAKLEPRLFLGSAAHKLSPVPVPKRVLYGSRDSAARAAAKRS